jgi:hypothetical protein
MHMNMSANLKHELKLHLFWVRTTVPAVFVWVLLYKFVPASYCPKELWIFMGPVCVVAHYWWWRQCLSPDKKTFTPRVWK